MRGISSSLVFIVPSSLALLLYNWSMNSGTLARDLVNGQRTISAMAQMMYNLGIMMETTFFLVCLKVMFFNCRGCIFIPKNVL